MKIIGIDPGLSGAIAVLENNQVLNIFDIPVMSEGKKNKRQLNSALLVNLLKENINKEEEVAFQNFFSNSSIELLIFLNNLILSKISAQEKIEQAINKIITDLTTQSALKKSFHIEKSVAPPKPTTCAAISCSINANYF